MKRANRLLKAGVYSLLLVAFFIAPLLPAAVPASASAGKQVVGYFIEWGVYGRGYLVKNIATSDSADQLTVINYAFGNVTPDDSGNIVCKLGDDWADYQMPWTAEQSVDGQAVTWPNPILGNFQQLKALKAMYPNIKVVISLGGWTWSKYFSDAALTPESRQTLAQSCVDLFIKGNLPDAGWGGMGGPGSAAGVFDGIDIDWEYPAAEGNPGNIYRPEDTKNFTALLAEFRKQLDAVQPGLLLTIASPAGYENASKIQLGKVGKIVDWMNLMTYDFHGTWDASTNFQSNLLSSPKDPSRPRYSDVDVVKNYLKAGVPPWKIVLGVPFYGHGWTGVNDVNHGLYQPAAGAAPATWEAGTEDYKVLKTLIGTDGYQRYWDVRTQAAWLFNGTTFWTYDDEITMKIKAVTARKMLLGGIMFWELSGDDGSGTLIHSIGSGLIP